MRPGVKLMRPRNVDPADICMRVAGIPVADFLSEPIKIVQAPRETMILYEVGNLHRQTFADGRTLPKEFDLPAYLGYSVGHWEGDTFVVETAGFHNKAALYGMGHPHSESLHLTERFHRRAFGHLDWEMTFDVPSFTPKPSPSRSRTICCPAPTFLKCTAKTRRTASTWANSRHLPVR